MDTRRLAGLVVLLVGALITASCSTGSASKPVFLYATPSASVQHACDLVTLDTSSGHVERLTRNGASVQPAITPDGRAVAFRLGYDTDENNKYEPGFRIQDLDGKNRRRLTRGEDWEPSWSPDGRLAFTRQANGSEIFIRETDGRVHPAFDRNEISFPRFPSWAPDGRRLAFLSVDEAGQSVYVARPGGAATSVYTAAVRGTISGRPAWSRDGRFLAIGVSRLGVVIVDVARRTSIRSFARLGLAVWIDDHRLYAVRSNVATNYHGEFIIEVNVRTGRERTVSRVPMSALTGGTCYSGLAIVPSR